MTLLVEAVAQGAALLLTAEEAAAAGRLYLAGIEDATLTVELDPGHKVTIEVRLLARLAGVVRVRGEVLKDGEPCGGATLVLASGGNG